MGYKNYSEICPIFNTDNNSGLEHELIANVQLSCTTTSYPMFQWMPGREVVLQEVFLVGQNSTGLTTALSCTLQIASDASSSTVIGSIDCGTAAMTDYLGAVLLSGSLTSTALTSTDVVSLWAVVGSGACKPNGNTVIFRYREK